METRSVVCSHDTNQNLLQRSEVVALINTLHRFSESLHAVEHFREMWKKTGEGDSARLIHEAERAVSGNVSPRCHWEFGCAVE